MRAARLLAWLLTPIRACFAFVGRTIVSEYRAFQESTQRQYGRPLRPPIREFIALAESVEVFALCGLTEKSDTEFAGCGVTGRAVVSDPEARKLVVGSILAATASPPNGMQCIDAEYGVRITVGEQVLDLMICFGCRNVWARGSEQLTGMGNIARKPLAPVLDSVLKRAGIALPH